MGGGADPAREHLTRPLTVIVPVYNEGANLRAWWAEAKPHLPAGATVRIVYDFDEDDTLPVASELAAAGAPIVPLKNATRGALGALKTGLASVPDGPVLVSMADLSDDIALVPELVRQWREGAAVVVASRYMPGGRQEGGGFIKSGFSRLGGLSLYWLAGFPTRDATNNFRLYDGAFVNGLALESTGGFELAFEITLKAWQAGRKVVEIPASWRDRTEGESRFNFRKWLPLYARLWLTALRFGLFRRRWT